MAKDELGLDEDVPATDRKVKKTDNAKNAASDELLSFIERVERLLEERQTINGDIKDVLGEAVGRGYDKKAINKIIAIRKKDKNEYLEEQAVLETYMQALGLLVLDSMDDA